MLFFILGMITYIRRQWAKFYNSCLKNSLVIYWTQIAIYNISQSLVSHKILPPYNHWSFIHYSPKFSEIIYRTEMPTAEQIASIINIPCDTPNALIMCHYTEGTYDSLTHSPAAIHCYVSPPTVLRTSEKVSRQFLSILYSHPQMKETIPIDLDASIYLVGNEILSAAFVERYLMYQSRPYVFDANYKLEMMNKKIQMFEMYSGQYVVLNKTGYLIM
jgi:hypothetical protein